MNRDWIIAAGLGLLTAAALASLMAGSFGAVILAYLAPLPLFLAGLGFGTAKAVLAAAIGALGAMALGPGSLVSYLASMALPAVVLTRQALLFRADAAGKVEWYPAGLLATWLAGLTAAAFLVAVIWTADTEGGLPGALRPRLEAMLAQMAPASGQGFDAAALAEAFAWSMPSVVAATWMLVVVGNGVLAQGLLSRFGRNLRPGEAIAAFRLPPAVALAFVGCAVAALLLSGLWAFVAATLAAICGVPLFLQGLALVHALAARTPARGFLLAGFYLLLVLSGLLAVPVAALGLVEQWADIRRRIGGRGQGKEGA